MVGVTKTPFHQFGIVLTVFLSFSISLKFRIFLRFSFSNKRSNFLVFFTDISYISGVRCCVSGKWREYFVFGAIPESKPLVLIAKSCQRIGDSWPFGDGRCIEAN